MDSDYRKTEYRDLVSLRPTEMGQTCRAQSARVLGGRSMRCRIPPRNVLHRGEGSVSHQRRMNAEQADRVQRNQGSCGSRCLRD